MTKKPCQTAQHPSFGRENPCHRDDEGAELGLSVPVRPPPDDLFAAYRMYLSVTG